MPSLSGLFFVYEASVNMCIEIYAFFATDKPSELYLGDIS